MHHLFQSSLTCELAVPSSPTDEGGTQGDLSSPSGRSKVELVSAWGPTCTPPPDPDLSFLFQALKRQSSLGLSFFNSILAHGDLRNNRLNQLSVNLWHLAQRHGCADTRTMVRLWEYGGPGERHKPTGQSTTGLSLSAQRTPVSSSF